ncbi:glycoside hydrolase family 99-like domain-containing protein [Pedobacter sp. R-06]|uniref:glycoside hydrolase family 99-like domain-containing protein n=1 Tax=Pedobacter sp. R-06 TaxID=3404051 RepID=UPI003CF5452E
MKTNFKYISQALFLIALTIFSSCKKEDEGPSIDDNFLNYEIPEIPVTENYHVGAFYTYFTTFHANVKQIPVGGKYVMSATTGIPLATATRQIDNAVKGGLDYFVFNMRSPNRDVNNQKIDSIVVKSFLNADTEGKLKFAIQFNWSGAYGLTTTAPLENDATKLSQFYKDIARFEYLFKNPNYMKVGGKALFYILNAQNLFSNDNTVIYKELRKRMSALGVELYIVGQQERWSPPARYAHRFKGCVDAVYHSAMAPDYYDRLYLLPQFMDQNWKYSKQWFADNISVDYVPNIFPAYSWNIVNVNQTNPNVLRNDGGAMYKKLCNVAKGNASSATRLILIDSFNDYQLDTQLEPTESYGDFYLDVTRQQFKK